MDNQVRNKFIGIFDSGFGGLNVMRDIVKELPEYNFIYLGDTARVPYGSRTPDVIYGFTKQAVKFLFDNNCDLIIIACNTVSSVALRRIQQEYLLKYYPGRRVLGVLRPIAEFTSLKTKNNRVGVIATDRTVASKAYKREFLKIDPKISVFQNACPLLVPLIEAGEYNSIAADFFLKKYLKPLIFNKVDTLILGCTHYRVLKNNIRKIVGNKVNIIPDGHVVAIKLKDYLKRHSEIESKLSKKGQLFFYSTDLTNNFNQLGSKFFGQKVEALKADIDKQHE